MCTFLNSQIQSKTPMKEKILQPSQKILDRTDLTQINATPPLHPLDFILGLLL